MIALLLAVLAGPAMAQTTDTFGGTATSNTGNFDYKLNTFDVTAAATLEEIEVWAASGNFGAANVTFVVYEEGGANSWDLIWEQGGSISTSLDWQGIVVPSVQLVPGRSYAIGYYTGFDDVEYAYTNGAPLETVTWGSRTGALYSGNGSVFFRPDPLNDSISGLGYRQRLTVDIGTDNDGDGWPDNVDCDDADPNINPGAQESCDGVDEDCDGVADNDVVYADYWPDLDGDGFGDAAATAANTCDGPPADHVANDRDCDDGDAGIHPQAAELCDGIDQDCDQVPDNGVVFVDYWPDGDGDGFGDGGAEATSACDGAPTGFVDNARDCDDSASTTYPDAPELCNETDDDCDLEVDEDVVFSDYWPDEDGDGFGNRDVGPVSDCVAPAGFVDNDGDCNDGIAVVNPDATELCDGLDNNCDDDLLPDEIDSDLDGILDCGDCDPTDPEVFPGAAESCNGIDNDCDGKIPTDAECNPYADEGLLPAVACGCSSTQGSVPPVLVLLGMLGLVRRRR